MRLFIGTAGWNYYDWKGIFYPDDLPSKKQLEFYSQHFNLVEINVSFYRFVRESTYRKWHEQTPDDFSFTAKIHRYFSHLKRLQVDEEVISTWTKFIEPLQAGLKGKIKALLLQLPPSLKADIPVLEHWLQNVYKTEIPLFIEGRHASWLSDNVVNFLKENNVGFVFSHCIKWDSDPRIKTTEDTYWRFHGPQKPFYSIYSEEEMQQFACLLNDLQPRQAFVIFNNTYRGNAVQNALQFAKFLVSC